MSDCRVGFTFTDRVWGGNDQGEIIGREGDRWVVCWRTGPSEVTYETDETINDMIRGELS